jgi:hypothetical protein
MAKGTHSIFLTNFDYYTTLFPHCWRQLTLRHGVSNWNWIGISRPPESRLNTTTLCASRWDEDGNLKEFQATRFEFLAEDADAVTRLKQLLPEDLHSHVVYGLPCNSTTQKTP